MIGAVADVHDRALRATRALADANLPYAVVGGLAVAAHVSKFDREAVRNTRDVDILVRREDLDRITAAMVSAGFVFAHFMDVTMFLDGPEGLPSGGIHLLFAGEKVRADYVVAAPDVTASEPAADYQIIKLEPLLDMKLMSYRDKDRVHIRDLISVGAVTADWLARTPEPLRPRLQQILETPDG